MLKKNLLVLFLSLLAIPIVKADGCGILCPHHPANALEWILIALCNLFTWAFCHVASFIITLIAIVIIIAFWYQLAKKKRNKIVYFLVCLLLIVFIASLWPLIKFFTYTPISNSTVNPAYCGDGIKNGLEQCEQDSDCTLVNFCEKNAYQYDCTCRPRCDSPINHFDIPDSDDLDYACNIPTSGGVPITIHRTTGTGLGYNGVPNNDEDYYYFTEVDNYFTASINNTEWCLYFKNEAGVFYPITDRCDYCCVTDLTSDVLGEGGFFLTVRRVSGTGYPTPYELTTNYNPA